MKKIIDNVFDVIIKQNGLIEQEASLLAIKDILFQNFNKKILEKNQKFDFSFSFASRNKKNIRFSYNNFDEKKDFSKKLKKVFSLFGDRFDIDKLNELLEKTKSASAKFQTTIGLEWKQGESLPRFKLYFEELFNFYTSVERRSLLDEIAGCIGFNNLGFDVGDNVGAIAVDFLPDGIYDLKVYDFYPVISRFQIEESLQEFGGKSSKTLLDIFYNELSNEKKSFNYLTRRMSINNLKSIKLYKIYEVQQITDYRASFAEIAHYLKEVNSESRDEIRKIAQLCRRYNSVIYPVIISVDFSSFGNCESDLYLSIK